MPVQRQVQVDADPQTTYDAVRRVLIPNVESGSFLVWEDDPGAYYGIASRMALGSARYRFALQPEGDGTRLEGTLWLGGLIGPIHGLLRRSGNRKHIDDLLQRMKRRAEGQGTDESSDDDAYEDEDEDGYEDDEYDDGDGRNNG